MLVISIIIMTIYLVLLVWFSNSIYYNQDTSDEKYAPNVSVIVASRNEEKNLHPLITNLSRLEYFDVSIFEHLKPHTKGISAFFPNFLKIASIKIA